MSDEKIFHLVLHKQIGPVALEMTRNSLRTALDEKYTATEAYKDEDLDGMEIYASDYFEESGIKVEYNKKNKVIFIEAGDLIPVYYESYSLFEMSFEEVYTLFKKLDPAIELDESGFTSAKLSLSAYAPEHNDDSQKPIELISIFSNHYLEGIL